MISAEATLIVLRESLEAFLIISILTGLVTKFGKPDAKRYLLAGAGAAVAAVVLLGFLADATARDFLEQSGSEALFAATASLAAVVILTYMIVWMYKHTIGLVSDMRKKAVSAIEVGKPLVLFALAFIAVSREGIETVLFFATLAPSTPPLSLILSTLVGFGASAVLAYLVFNGIVRLNMQRFFTISGLLLVLFASGLLVGAVHDYSEAGVLPETPIAWSTHGILSQDSIAGSLASAVLGYHDSPTWGEVAAYVAYAFSVGAWYLRGVRLHMRGREPVAS